MPSIVAFDRSALQINSSSAAPRSPESHNGSGRDFAEFLDSRPVADEPRQPMARSQAHGNAKDAPSSARVSDPSRSKPADTSSERRDARAADEDKDVEVGTDKQTDTPVQAGSETEVSATKDAAISAQLDATAALAAATTDATAPATPTTNTAGDPAAQAAPVAAEPALKLEQTAPLATPAAAAEADVAETAVVAIADAKGAKPQAAAAAGSGATAAASASPERAPAAAEPDTLAKQAPTLPQTASPKAAEAHEPDGKGRSDEAHAEKAARATADQTAPSANASPVAKAATDAVHALNAMQPSNWQPASAAAANPHLPLNATPTAGHVPVSGLAIEIASQASAGKQHFEIRLDPPELGRIDVRLDMDGDGNVTSRLVVDRVETLDLLRRDAPQLERALQQAGLKTAGDALQFSLRDQGATRDQAAQENSNRIVVPDDLATAEAMPAPQAYGRLLGLGSGLDIRV